MKIKKKKKHIEETFGEEIANFASHTAGAGLSIIALVILTIRASWARNPAAIVKITRAMIDNIYNVFNLSWFKAWYS